MPLIKLSLVSFVSRKSSVGRFVSRWWSRRTSSRKRESFPSSVGRIPVKSSDVGALKYRDVKEVSIPISEGILPFAEPRRPRLSRLARFSEMVFSAGPNFSSFTSSLNKPESPTISFGIVPTKLLSAAEMKMRSQITSQKRLNGYSLSN